MEHLIDPSMTFLKALIQGRSDGDWKTTPRSGPGPLSSLPARTIPPEVTVLSPATIMRIVDFPQPEWPIIVTNSPLRNLKLMFLTITASPLWRGIALGQIPQLEISPIAHTATSTVSRFCSLRLRGRRLPPKIERGSLRSSGKDRAR